MSEDISQDIEKLRTDATKGFDGIVEQMKEVATAVNNNTSAINRLKKGRYDGAAKTSFAGNVFLIGIVCFFAGLYFG